MAKYIRKSGFGERLITAFGNTKIFGAFFTLLLVLVLPVTILFLQHKQVTNEHAAGIGMPHVVGNLIVDGNGNPLMLRGAQIEGLLNGNDWNSSANTVAANYATSVQTMHDRWYMNVLRLPTCNWEWGADPVTYMTKLQAAVQQANQAGLYVIIENHDDHRCVTKGNHSLYDPNDINHLPRPAITDATTGMTYPGVDTYMATVAAAFKDNPMVIFDVYNEPSLTDVDRRHYTSDEWSLWLNGGQRANAAGQQEQFIGMQTIVNAIRSTGAQQIIMVEGYTFGSTYIGIGNNLIQDPLHNIVYEVHNYYLDPSQTGQSDWSTFWGFMDLPPYNLPLFLGEWAFMDSDNNGNMNCGNVPQAQAHTAVATFLSYLAARNIGWTAYAFSPQHLILDYSYAPTSLDTTPYCVESGTGGMGLDVQQYLYANRPTPTPTPTPSPTDTPTPTPTPSPSPTPSPTPTPTVPPTPTPLIQVSRDTFFRGNQIYWGSSNDGHTWQGQANSSSAFSIQKGYGLVANSGGNNIYDALNGPPITNVSVMAQGLISALDANDTLGVLLRYTDANDCYIAYIDGTNLVITKRVNQVRAMLATIPFSAQANVAYDVSFKVRGSTLSASAWAAASAKPTNAMLTVTDTSLSTGFAGIRTHLVNTSVAKYNLFQEYQL